MGCIHASASNSCILCSCCIRFVRDEMRWGPAGIPMEFEGDTAGAIGYTAKEGLNAFECEFVRGVKMRNDMAANVRKEAEKNKVSLSAHAPYWVNCAAKEKMKIDSTLRNIFDTAKIAKVLGASV